MNTNTPPQQPTRPAWKAFAAKKRAERFANRYQVAQRPQRRSLVVLR